MRNICIINSLKKPFLPLVKTLGKYIENNKFSDDPVFIGGCARSGTTLLLSILSAHKELFCCPKELEPFTKIEDGKFEKPQPKRIDRLYTCLLINKIPNTARRWCEKSPRNILRINEIDQYYSGNFKFIQIVRDGRDVVLSNHPTAKNEFWVSPERWINDVSVGMSFAGHSNVHTIRYEDLIENFDDTIRGVCEFLGIPFSEEIANWHQHAKVRRNRAYFSPRVSEISNKSIGKWKKAKHKDRIRQLMENPRALELLDNYGYL